MPHWRNIGRKTGRNSKRLSPYHVFTEDTTIFVRADPDATDNTYYATNYSPGRQYFNQAHRMQAGVQLNQSRVCEGLMWSLTPWPET